MSKILIWIAKSPKISMLIVRLSLSLHNHLYKIASNLSIPANAGVHPKHNIINYFSWFKEKIPEDTVVIDIGCKTGSMISSLKDKCKYIYGIDFDKNAIAYAKRINIYENVEFIYGDATTFDFSACKEIDVIILSNVLEHISNRVSFLNKIISRVNWSNVNEKTLLFRVPLIERDWITVYKKSIGVDYRLDSTHFTEYSERSFALEMEKANINIVESKIYFGELYAVGKIFNI